MHSSELRESKRGPKIQKFFVCKQDFRSFARGIVFLSMVDGCVRETLFLKKSLT